MRRSNPLPAPTPTRILIVRTGSMGDILHALPAAAALRLALPDAFIGWAVEPHWQPLLSASPTEIRGPLQPLVDHIHPVPTRAWKQRPVSLATGREIATLRRHLRAMQYDIAVDLQGSLRSAALARLSGAPVIVGSAHPRERPARLAYTHPLQLTHSSVIHQACELLSAATSQLIDLPLTPAPVVLPQDAAAADLWLDSLSLDPSFTLLIPGAGWGAKQWPSAHFAALTKSLLFQGHTVLVNAGSDADQPLQHAGARLVQSSVAELIALTRRAALVVGGDTGPVHLAAALRRPTIALFGPTDPARNGPHFPGARTVILRNPASLTSHRRTPDTESGLVGITVDQVLTAIQAVLAPPAHG